MSGVDFKNQTEAKAYVKRLGIEYRYGCLEEKEADACHLLGEYMASIEENPQGAFQIYKENCLQRKHAKSCYNYGCYVYKGKVGPPDGKEGVKALRISCDGDFSEACRQLGLILLDAKPPDINEAQTFLEKACNLENGNACWDLNSRYLGTASKPADLAPKPYGSESDNQSSQSQNKLPVDLKKALEYGIKACDLQCYQGCINVGIMYKHGIFVEKNEEKAKSFFQKAKDVTFAVDHNITM